MLEKEFLYGLCNLLEEAVALLSQERKVIHYNKKFVEMFGVEEEILKSGNFKEFFKFASKKLKKPEEFKNWIERVLTSDKKVECLIETKDGKFFESYSLPYFFEGKVVGKLVVIRDVTERKRDEERLKELNKQLQETNKKLLEIQKKLKKSYKELRKLDLEKDKFISIAAHELKTPMAAISGFAQLLREEETIKDKEKREKYLKIINEEIKRLSKLVTDILDLSRIDIGTIKVFAEEVNINEILNEVKNEMIELAKEKSLYLNVEIEKKISNIITDREKLKEILINLVSNSIKYTEKGGIAIKVEKEDGEIKFSISDTGIGIPKEHFNKIFTRFYQIASPQTRKATGSGLGLSISKEFVELLGGKIWFESKVGKGTTFYFTLPIKYKTVKKL